MSTETERLERDVESHRSTVESTIEELKSRLSVGQIVDELSTYVKDGQGADIARNLGRQVRDNPLALGLVGAGVAWLLMGQGVRAQASRLSGTHDDWDRTGGPSYRSAALGDRAGYSSDYADDDTGFAADDRDSYESRSTLFEVGGSGQIDTASSSDGSGGAGSSGLGNIAGSVGDGLSSAKSSLSSAFESAADAASSKVSDVRRKARAYRHDIGDAAWQAEESARRRAQQVGQGAARLGGQAGRTIVDTFTQEPLILGAIVVAIGAAIGASLPSSSAENALMGDARDRLLNEALERGKDVLDKAKTVATETYRSASEEVGRQGLKPSGEGSTIAQKLSDVVKTATETAKSKAQEEGLV